MRTKTCILRQTKNLQNIRNHLCRRQQQQQLCSREQYTSSWLQGCWRLIVCQESIKRHKGPKLPGERFGILPILQMCQQQSAYCSIWSNWASRRSDLPELPCLQPRPRTNVDALELVGGLCLQSGPSSPTTRIGDSSQHQHQRPASKNTHTRVRQRGARLPCALC